VLQRAGVDAIVGELEAAAMAQHVRMSREQAPHRSECRGCGRSRSNITGGRAPTHGYAATREPRLSPLKPPRFMYQTLDSEIRECYLHAAGAIAVAIGLQGKIFRNGETLAPPSPHYKFAEQLPNFSKPVRKQGPFPVGDQ